MPKAPVRFPKVFLACPFDKHMKTLVEQLRRLPWTIHPANARITSDHLLTKITDDLLACDFAIFDISGWNPNVCLELGLARGLGVEYYIVNNNSKKKDAPSDIKGIERIDYNWNKRKKAANLFDQIMEGIFKKHFVTKQLWSSLSAVPNAEKKFKVVLYALSSFRNGKSKLTRADLRMLARGLNLRKEEDYDDVINVLVKNNCCKKLQGSGAITLTRKLFKK